MKPDFNLDDPRITAYYLNELTSVERAQFEKEMATNPALKSAVKELNETATILKTELREEVLPSWKLKDPQPVSLWQRYGTLAKLALPVAACATFAIIMFGRTQNLKQTPPPVAEVEDPFDDYNKFEEPNAPLETPDQSVAANDLSEDELETAETSAATESEEIPATNTFGGNSLVAKKKMLVSGVGVQIDHLPRMLPAASQETYGEFSENKFMSALENPLSTFSIDVDTASYANLRRFLNNKQRPPVDAVRIEEMVNYFTYDYSEPTGEHPVVVNTELAKAPWDAEHYLLKLGLKAKSIAWNSKGSNLVFLLDVSGSMADENKLPLLKQGLKLLVNNLKENDRISIVVYAGASGLVLPPTAGNKKADILKALDELESGGATNGGQGIELAYATAQGQFIEGGVNRVILGSDGDFNVGITDSAALNKLIQEKAKGGVFLSVLGFGSGNLKDSIMESLANKGNGNYSYIDSAKEAKKVLVEQAGGTLLTVAKDVKLQLEFNPAKIAGYRLIGYENRMLNKEDFNDDKKDAGEMGSGHNVTALYELIPAGVKIPGGVDALKYQGNDKKLAPSVNHSNEWLTVKLRYKKPNGEKSFLIEQALRGDVKDFGATSRDFKFASAVAGFGMILRDSPHKGDTTYDLVKKWANQGRGTDPGGYRAEFLKLVEKAKALKP